MRIWHLVTVAAVGLARDSAWNVAMGQGIAVAAQAVPVITRATHTATRSDLTEGYLSQPIIMGHAWWKGVSGLGMLNLEGLTLRRGELNTGGYGEGYVDRRHPHAYVHELMFGAQGSAVGTNASIFAGRGFAPFGSDDPMVRPFEKYPINHHLAQILERSAAVAAVRRGPVIGEFGTFNGDEPLGPGTAPNYRRFGDSWSSRVTLLPLDGVELSGSIARVRSPEQRFGAGLNQNKSSLVARYERFSPTTWRYGLVEWERTDERDRGETITSLGSVLAEAAYCRAGITVAARAERTDRPEEERLANPFRSPRPAPDLSNLGVSRWTAFTVSVSAPPVRTRFFSARPIVEIEHLSAAPGNPPGIFNADHQYGARRMWMLSVGERLFVGSPHHRMGRYGAALPTSEMGTHTHSGESHEMPAGAHDMMSMPAAHPPVNQCSQ